ncbi:MAG: putative metal-dependent hydrolase [Gemmatimonadaceae bacterium]
MIDDLAAAPAALQKATRGLTDSQFETPYRPGGWTVRQVVHHVADSHLNAYLRCKLALTEQSPTIKPYDQDAWAALSDSRTVPAATSLSLIEALHTRWVALLRAAAPPDFLRTFVHPESGVNTLDRMLAVYAWHGKHHTAHVTSLRERNGWS